MRTILFVAAVAGLIGALGVPVSAQPNVLEEIVLPDAAVAARTKATIDAAAADASDARKKAAQDTAAARAAKQKK